MKNGSGFTLTEILIVVVIIGIISGISMPVYVKAIERGRQAEAITILNSMRDAQLRFYYETGGKYAGVIGPPDWVDPITKYFDVESFYDDNGTANGIAKVTRRDVQLGNFPPDYGMWIYVNGIIDKDPNVP